MGDHCETKGGVSFCCRSSFCSSSSFCCCSIHHHPDSSYLPEATHTNQTFSQKTPAVDFFPWFNFSRTELFRLVIFFPRNDEQETHPVSGCTAQFTVDRPGGRSASLVGVPSCSHQSKLLHFSRSVLFLLSSLSFFFFPSSTKMCAWRFPAPASNSVRVGAAVQI